MKASIEPHLSELRRARSEVEALLQGFDSPGMFPQLGRGLTYIEALTWERDLYGRVIANIERRHACLA